MYPSLTMPPTSHMHVPLNYYCGVHIELILPDIQVQKTNKLQLVINMLLSFMCRNKYAPQMPNIYHICQLVHVQVSDNNISKYASYECPAVNNVTMNTDIHTFLLLAYAHEQICLPHCSYISHCTSTVGYIKIPHYIQVKKNEKLQLIVTILYQYIGQQQICPSNAT